MKHRTATATAATASPLVHWMFFCLAIGAAIFLSGCAGTLPGGTENINKNYYESDQQLQGWMDELQPGMSQAEVFSRLGRTRPDFTHLTRSEIVSVLFGGRDSGIPAIFRTDEDIQHFLASLDGYKFEYKSIKKKLGFTSPIRIQTDASGFSYTVNLIFRNGVLYEKPILTGGKIASSSSKTLFDYLSPGLVLGSVE